MDTPFEEMKRYIGFVEEDSANLATLCPLVAPHLDGIVERFYERILSNAETRRVLSGPGQIDRLKGALRQWLLELFEGPHDDAYYTARSRIGRTHVRVGLPQRYMFTAMGVIRDAIEEVVAERMADEGRRATVLRSLNKLLDLELAMMLETYREESVARQQHSEQEATIRRLADIGEMAATLAHEVRNPLAGISGAVEIIRDEMPPDSPRREVIHEILSQVRRLDERVRDLLLYARREPPRRERVDLAELMSGTLALLSSEPMMKKVRAHVTVGGTATHLMDRGQIQEVLVNLIRNAARAMQGRGEMYLEASPMSGGGIRIVVEDTGPGIPQQRLEDAFRPFFTTWPEGTGLGLSICRKILEAHGGSLIYEAGNRGARFVASLPRAEAAA